MGILDLCLDTRSEGGGGERAKATFNGLGGAVCKLVMLVLWGREHSLLEFLSLPPIALFPVL